LIYSAIPKIKEGQNPSKAGELEHFISYELF